MPNRYKLAIVSPILRELCSLPFVTPKAMAMSPWQRAMNGKVDNRRLLLPKVSMVQKAGSANTKLITPKPREARRAGVACKPARRRMVLL